MNIFKDSTRNASLSRPPPNAPIQHSPPKSNKLTSAIDRATMSESDIKEYRQVAEEVGVSAEDLLVEEFRIFLVKHDIPTFNLFEAVKYMDGIAAKDNPTGLGWHWCPVRPKDAEIPLTFGRPSRDDRSASERTRTVASDFYESHRFQQIESYKRHGWGYRDSPMDWRTMPSPAYTRTIPLHALKKIAFVERNFTAGKVAFLVTDYTIAPHIVVNPDPFLMVVIPNNAVAHGKGRFIIDVWDEPGFGIDRMVK